MTVPLRDAGERSALATNDIAQLQRKLGTFELTVTGVGTILGAGIYVLIGAAAGRAGSGVWLSFALAALAAGLTGLSYAELASAYPKAGATFEYARQAFGVRTGFVAGWLMLVAATVQVAAVGLGFGGYLAALAGTGAAWRVPAAVALISAGGLLLLAGVKEPVRVGVLFAFAELAGLILVVTVAAPHIGDADLLVFPFGAAGVLQGAALVFFAVLGFEQVANLAEEARDTRRGLPVAIVTAMAVTSGIYVLVALAAVSVVRWDELARSNAPLALVVQRVTGAELSRVVTVIALFAAANTVLFGLLSASRQIYGMARAGALPRVLGAVNARRGAPVAAVVLVTLAAALVTLAGDIGRVAKTSNAAVLLAFVGVNGSLVWLRYRGAMPGGGFSTVWSIGRVPVIPVLGAAASAFMLTYTGWQAVFLAAVLLLIGLEMSRLTLLQRRPL